MTSPAKNFERSNLTSSPALGRGWVQFALHVFHHQVFGHCMEVGKRKIQARLCRQDGKGLSVAEFDHALLRTCVSFITRHHAKGLKWAHQHGATNLPLPGYPFSGRSNPLPVPCPVITLPEEPWSRRVASADFLRRPPRSGRR